MKKLIAIIALLSLITACKGSTDYGPCKGLSEAYDDENVVYEISVRNTFWSFIAVETVIAPVLWATSFARCPVAKKP